MSKKVIKWRWIATLAMVFIMVSQTSYAAGVYMDPTQDTWISSGEEADTPHGSDTYIWVANPKHYTAYGLIKFDDFSSIPEKSLIHSVTLKLFCYHHNYVAPDYLNVYEVKGPWDESTLIWNNLPDFDPAPLAKEPVNNSVQGSWVSWSGANLTELVKKWHQGTKSNYGLLIQAHTESNNTYGFISKEANRYKPVLEVKYTQPRANIVINVESPSGKAVVPETSILYKHNTSWQEVDRKNPIAHTYTFKDKIAGKYNVDAYVDDMFVGETGPFSLKGEDVHKTIITPNKRSLKVRVYYSDGKTPLRRRLFKKGALLKLYSWDGYRREYTYRRGKYTDIQGKVSFNCWPTLLSDKGEHYLIQVVHKDSVIGKVPRVVVDKDKGANISVTTTLPYSS